MFASLLSKDLKNLQIKNIQSHMLQGSHKNVIAVCEHTREYQPRLQAKQQQYEKNISKYRVIPVI